MITLDTLHSYCSGPVPTPEAHRLNAYSHWRKFLHLGSFLPSSSYLCLLINVCLLPFEEMEAAKQRALVRVSAIVRKQKEKEGTFLLAPKGVIKGSSERKSEGKDDRPLKKGPAFPTGDKPKKSSPPKPRHRAGKGLMMATGPIT